MRLNPIFAGIIGILALACAAHAGPVEAVGLKIGVSRARQTLTDITTTRTYDFRTGASLGLFARWLPVGPFSLVTEASFVEKGNMREVRDETGEMAVLPGRYETVVRYLSFPMLVRFGHRFGPLEPYAFAGPRVDVLLDTGKTWYEWDDGYQSTVWGLEAGAGASLSLNPRLAVSLEARYGHDLTDAARTRSVKFNEIGEIEAVGTASLRNISWQVLYGVSWRL